MNCSMDKLKELFDVGWAVSGEMIPGERYILTAKFKAFKDEGKKVIEEQFVSNGNLRKAIDNLYDKCIEAHRDGL